MTVFKEDIIKALKEGLPGEKSHRSMLPSGRELRLTAADSGFVKQSGVLFLVCPSGNELITFLIKRPATMKDHAGRIGFPGGKCEKSDRGPLDTAIRESAEEIGITPDDFCILGPLSPLYVQVSRFMIHPYLGWCDTIPGFHPNPHEVEKLIFLPLLNLISERKIVFAEFDTYTGKLMVPAFPSDGEMIWGATAMIIAEFLDVLERIFREPPKS